MLLDDGMGGPASASCANHYGGNAWALLLHRVVMGFFMVCAMDCTVALALFFLFFCFRVVQEAIPTINAMFTELWRAFMALGNIIYGALCEVWQYSTRDNLSSLIATGIILYSLPDFYPILMKIFRESLDMRHCEKKS